MTLSPEDGKLFFELMWSLQSYVNRQRGFYKNIATPDEYAGLSSEKKLKVRDALWEHPEWIEAYVRENPEMLPPEELGIVQNWKGFVKGSFFLFRHLKKGSIFMGDNRVYAVHGLQDALEDVIPSFALPQMVQAVLLPFKGLIVYDGLLQTYNLVIGGGIRSTLAHEYTVAKHKGRIITSLESEPTAPRQPLQIRKSVLPALQEVHAGIQKVKGDSPLQTSALALSRASLELAIFDAQGVSASKELEAQARKTRRACTRLLHLLDILEED